MRKFATSARLAKKVGFTGVQIHAAHGYLASQFLSPRHNQRLDRWGGSVQDRLRFLLEVYKSTRAEVGDDYPVSVKLNTADFVKDGFSESDSITVIEALAEVGVDLVEVSGGSYENMSFVHGRDGGSRDEEAYFLGHARKARQRVDVPLLVTGGFRTRNSMDRALADGSTDLIGLGRPLILDPGFARKILHDEEVTGSIEPRRAGVSVIDGNHLLTTMWYEQQLRLMATGRDPDPGLNMWKVLMRVLLEQGPYALRKRRA